MQDPDARGEAAEDQGVTAGVVQAGFPGVLTRNVRFEPSEARGPPSGDSVVAGGHRFGIAGLPPIGAHITGCPTTANDADIAEMLKSLQDSLLSATPGIPNLKTRMSKMREEHILFLVLQSLGREIDAPSDTGCTLTMTSGKHYDYAKSRKANIAYTHFGKPLPVSFAEEGKSLYAVGLAETPFEFAGICGRKVTIWLDVLVVPGLAWDLLLGQNPLAAMDVLTEHNARIQTFRAEAFGGLRVQ